MLTNRRTLAIDGFNFVCSEAEKVAVKPKSQDDVKTLQTRYLCRHTFALQVSGNVVTLKEF